MGGTATPQGPRRGDQPDAAVPGAADDPAVASATADGLVGRTLELAGALRAAGVAVTTSAAIDALRALLITDLLDRERVRATLAATLTSTATQRRPFEDLFDLHFPSVPAAGPHEVGVPATVEELRDALADAIGRGDADALRWLARASVDLLGRIEGRDGAASWFAYRTLRALDLDGLARELAERDAPPSGAVAWSLDARLRRDEVGALLGRLRHDVEADVRRRVAGQRGREQAARRLVRPSPEELDLLRLAPEDRERLRAQVVPLARKLATRAALRRHGGRHGRLDVRRTVRRSLATGGVPVHPVWRRRRPRRPELFVLCDVSPSVATFTRFTLTLVHALHEQVAGVRSFAFVDTIDEVTDLLRGVDVGEAIAHLAAEADVARMGRHSDYGNALATFHARHADELTPRSTVLVLGDARNNHRQAAVWALQDVRRRARRVLWLNPEPAEFWDTGDSIASAYARAVDAMVEVRNLRQLAAFIQDLA